MFDNDDDDIWNYFHTRAIQNSGVRNQWNAKLIPTAAAVAAKGEEMKWHGFKLWFHCWMLQTIRQFAYTRYSISLSSIAWKSTLWLGCKTKRKMSGQWTDVDYEQKREETVVHPTINTHNNNIGPEWYVTAMLAGQIMSISACDYCWMCGSTF